MKRNKNVILFFIVIFLFIIIEKNVLASEIDLKAESNYENFSNYVNIQVSSNVEMEKIYLFRKNNNGRYTIFKLINAHDDKKVDCRISFDKLSKTNDTEIKVLVVNKDKTNAEKTTIKASYENARAIEYEEGKPLVKFVNVENEELRKDLEKVKNIDISISHIKENAVGVAVAEIED